MMVLCCTTATLRCSSWIPASLECRPTYSVNSCTFYSQAQAGRNVWWPCFSIKVFCWVPASLPKFVHGLVICLDDSGENIFGEEKIDRLSGDTTHTASEQASEREICWLSSLPDICLLLLLMLLAAGR